MFDKKNPQKKTELGCIRAVKYPYVHAYRRMEEKKDNKMRGTKILEKKF